MLRHTVRSAMFRAITPKYANQVPLTVASQKWENIF